MWSHVFLCEHICSNWSRGLGWISLISAHAQPHWLLRSSGCSPRQRMGWRGDQVSFTTCGRSRVRWEELWWESELQSPRSPVSMVCGLATLRIAGFTWLIPLGSAHLFPGTLEVKSGRRGEFCRLVATSFGVTNQGKWYNPSACLPFWCCLSHWPCGY